VLIDLFLRTAAAPAFVVAVLFLLFGHAPEPWRARIQALIFAGGFWVGCYLLTGYPPFPPHGGAPSLVWVAVWFAGYSWVAPRGAAIRYLMRGIWVAGGVIIAIWSLRENILTSGLLSRNILAFVFLGWGMWSLLERSVKASHVLTPIALSVVSLTAASILFVLQGSILMSQMLTTLAVITGALAIIAWLWPARLSLHALFPFLGGLFGVFLVTGYIFLDANPYLVMSMAIPFLVLGFKNAFGFKASSAFADAATSIVIAAVPLGIILYKTFLASGPLY
jgi:hypothetical protein